MCQYLAASTVRSFVAVSRATFRRCRPGDGRQGLLTEPGGRVRADEDEGDGRGLPRHLRQERRRHGPGLFQRFAATSDEGIAQRGSISTVVAS